MQYSLRHAYAVLGIPIVIEIGCTLPDIKQKNVAFYIITVC